jgi:O-antigen/teichoic acid export membrane protein
MLVRLAQSPTLQAGVIYAVGGLGFAVGNILLARALTPNAFAWIALVLAVSQIGYTIGPMGVDTLINRFPVNPGRGLLLFVGISSVFASIAAALAGMKVYGFSPLLVFATVVICAASSVNLVGSSFFRSRGKFLFALALTQGHNLVILGAAGVALALHLTSEDVPLLIIAVAYLVAAIVGWIGAFRLERPENAVPAGSLPWREGLMIVAAGIAVILLIQVERLMIPKLLGTEYLATFAVLAAVAGSPYRVLQMGIGFTLLPRLRKAVGIDERKKIVKYEVLFAVVTTFTASIVVWYATIPFVDWFLKGKYELNAILIAAAIVAGLAKVLAAFATAGVGALGSASDLSKLNKSSWLGVAVAVIGAVYGARAGLEGVLFGVAAGWLIYALIALYVAWPSLLHAQDSKTNSN